MAVAEAGHFGRAAEAPHIAQPTVSQEAGRLERALGISLFDRSRRSARVTPAGEALAAEGRALLQHADQLVKTIGFSEPTRMRTARVVASPSVVNRLLPAVISRAERTLPSVAYRIEVLAEEQVFVALSRRHPQPVPLQMQWRVSDTRPNLVALRELVRDVASGL